jgi:tRNA U34 5-methylaminomethyl-2-thiouridine-forming methyltransferase MnmC
LEKLCSFEILWTGDGSPSLRGDNEPMHHLGGAYAETQYIYGDAIRRLQKWPALTPWKVLVVGLGLGYIELLAMAEALKNNKQLKLLSYEIKPELVEAFLGWLSGERQEAVYDKLYEFFQKDYPEIDIKSALAQAYKRGDWEIRGALEDQSLPSAHYHALLFDAFSGKTTPELWTPEFLALFLKQVVQDQSVFATYACTGNLKRTLQSAEFIVEKRPGFLGKRDSTTAVFDSNTGAKV